MLRVIAGLFLLLPLCRAEDGVDALKARQAAIKKAASTVEEREKQRQQAMKARGAEIQQVLEDAVADLAKAGIDFEKPTDEQATAQFPKLRKATGRAADGRVVRVSNSYTQELELLVQPLGGRMLKLTWAFYKDGSFKIGEDVSRGGRVFYSGKDFLDPNAVLANKKAIKDGLVKRLTAVSE